MVNGENVADFLGPPKFRYGEIEADDQVGLVTGLAWTEVGGELLTIEGVMMPGKGRMTVTGNLKDVMKESISAAASYVRSRAVDFGIEPPLFDKRDIHVHVPEGATPKDGPSAGVAMATVIVSMLTGIPVRRDIAMTGEITLRGRVLPIGGLKEKLLAALRGGIKKVLIPEENAKDSGRHPELGEERPRDRAGLAHGRGARARPRPSADADRMGGGCAGDRRRGDRRTRTAGPRRALTTIVPTPETRVSGPGGSAATGRWPRILGRFAAVFRSESSLREHLFLPSSPGEPLRSFGETASNELNSAVDSPGAAMSAFEERTGWSARRGSPYNTRRLLRRISELAPDNRAPYSNGEAK